MADTERAGLRPPESDTLAAAILAVMDSISDWLDPDEPALQATPEALAAARDALWEAAVRAGQDGTALQEATARAERAESEAARLRGIESAVCAYLVTCWRASIGRATEEDADAAMVQVLRALRVDAAGFEEGGAALAPQESDRA